MPKQKPKVDKKTKTVIYKFKEVSLRELAKLSKDWGTDLVYVSKTDSGVEVKIYDYENV